MSDENKRQRDYRSRVGNAPTKRYEKTPKGFLMRCYRNMKSRISGVQKSKHHLYAEKELLSKSDFYAWALGNASFWNLYINWAFNGFTRSLAPSVDRINPGKGYVIDNMEWVTHSENSRRAGKRRWDLYGTTPHDYRETA